MREILWFSGSPDAGDPSCICSWCEQQIGEEDVPVIRLFDPATGKEARFHLRCAGESGVLPGVHAIDDDWSA